MSQKSSVPQAVSFVSQVLKRDNGVNGKYFPVVYLVTSPF